MQRVSRESGTGAGEVYAARDLALEADHPLLCEHLCKTTFDGGEARETSTLLVFTGDGRFKGLLNNRAEGLGLWVSSDSLGGLLEALERCLDSPAPDWKAVRPVTQKRK